ncbi:unnamed protein product [Rotaria magnacalcarata]|uniref:Uncharacterized protein n=1 Tax=Rotaria magnacalcarata TaxID=392030 RepID=A0A815HF73_9BILA|nr:unnamed protein product [Rotaria magnacalcarata]
MSDAQVEVENSTESSSEKTILLDVAPRLQWDNRNGYCGETALQCIGLYYGVWISQALIRSINRGEYLLQRKSSSDLRDPIHTLSYLHFTYEEWDWMNAPQPQFRDYCRWMKRSILRRNPIMFGIFLRYMDYEDYDHIVPAIGIRYKTENEFDPEDVIIYYDLYKKKVFEGILNENKMGSTREFTRAKKYAGNAWIPLDIDYGIAITGILDENQVTLPVRLSVSAWNEPNPAFHEDPIEMDGTVTVYNLTIGNTYILLRYSSHRKVPTKGDVDVFLRSRFDEKHIFMADDTTYVYQDTKKIPSTGCVYYRCIPMPGDGNAT